MIIALHPEAHGLAAVVDATDAALVAGHKWAVVRSPNGSAYAHRSSYSKGRATSCLMHRLILRALPGQVVDHINGDGLDNRRANLRLCTGQENSRHRVAPGRNNTSGVIGVSRSNSISAPWSAYVKVDGRKIHLGTFAAFADAVRARRAAEAEHFGAFVCAVPV